MTIAFRSCFTADRRVHTPWEPHSEQGPLDTIIKIAHKHDVSISKLVRTWLRQSLKPR
jgi:hypothetical protein